MTNSFNDDGFVRGAVRLLIARKDHPTIKSVGDILVMRPGPSQYDTKMGFYDLGASRTGIQIVRDFEHEEYGLLHDRFTLPVSMRFKTQLAEYNYNSVQNLFNDRYTELEIQPHDPITVIALMQRSDKSIRAYVFENCRRLPMEVPVGFTKSGEGSAVPLECTFVSGTIYDQQEGEENVITFTDFESWRKSLP